MIRLGTSSARYDPVENLGTAVLRQAMFDLEKTSPVHIAKLRAKIDEPGISADLRYMRQWRWGEACDIREELLAWIGSEDFETVVGWSGFGVVEARKAFDATVKEQGPGVVRTAKLKRRKT